MIDAIGSEGHFVDHIKPIWLALPEDQRGTFYVRTARPDVPNTVVKVAPPSRNPTLVAAAGDLKRGRGRRNAMMEHGCGQSFGGDPRTLKWASYAGGANRDAELFLHPGNHPASRDRARYPNARVEVVGCAKLDSLPRRDRGDPPVAAVSFHWNCVICAETRPAFDGFKRQVAELSKTMTVIGHGHPRVLARLAAFYRLLGIETVRSFADVCARADVYINDASSTLYEFASTGRPVVVMNSKRYRRNVDHGLRFWEASTVGVNVEEGGDLTEAVRYALEDPPAQRRERERCVDLVYAYRSGAAERAAGVLMDWAGERVRAVA